MSVFYELPVTIRDKSYAYFARCQGQTASCTSRPETAAQRAAAKALNASGKITRKVNPDEILVVKERDGWVARIDLESGVAK